MKVIVLAVLAAAVLGVVAGLVFRQEQVFAFQAFSTPSARVGDPGYNLVGRHWTGDPNVGHDLVKE